MSILGLAKPWHPAIVDSIYGFSGHLDKTSNPRAWHCMMLAAEEMSIRRSYTHMMLGVNGMSDQ